jgi:hypothetical protein
MSILYYRLPFFIGSFSFNELFTLLLGGNSNAGLFSKKECERFVSEKEYVLKNEEL